MPKVWLVCDNLNAHNFSSLYEAFCAVEVREFAKRLEIRYTSKRGSWLNIAEIEFSVFSRQCLDEGIDKLGLLNESLLAWEQSRNSSQKGVDWQFTTKDARIKLKKLYLIIYDN